MDKKTEKYLLIGGVIIGGYFLWKWYQIQQAAQAVAPAAAPSSPEAATPSLPSVATAATATATATTPEVPTITEPTEAGAIGIDILAADAYNQWGAYNVVIQIAITNNMSIPAQLQGMNAEAYYLGQTEQSAMASSQPVPYTGNLGPISDSASVTIGPGQTAAKWYKVNVPVNSATNLYVANLAYFLAEDTLKQGSGNPLILRGSVVINGSTVPFTANYEV